jgi:hypothetical protein
MEGRNDVDLYKGILQWPMILKSIRSSARDAARSNPLSLGFAKKLTATFSCLFWHIPNFKTDLLRTAGA